jgi:hypothetical protein
MPIRKEDARPSGVTFFFDNCVPPPVVRALREARADVLYLQEVFASSDVKDTLWMPRAAQEGWIVLTDDNRIRRNPVERTMLKELKLRVIFLPEALPTLALMGQLAKLAQWWPDIERACKGLKAGTCLLMKMKTGKLEVLEK